jgi:tRNA pseudouridine38-40 synthase
MPRYFLEVAYKGTNYAGFQKQHNANSIQSEVEKALSTFFRTEYNLTGSSRTDAGVHAKQNFFHFDCEQLLSQKNFTKVIYHINAILPLDIVVQSIKEVNPRSHCRFDASSRTYEYIVYQNKNPFLQDRAYYYPYNLDINLLQQLAGEIMNHTDFESFAKRNTQVHTFFCTIFQSEWIFNENYLIFRITANRFLRGMVKGLVGTMLRLASKNESIIQFHSIILSKNPSMVDFAVPSHGLTLQNVNFKL